MKATRRPWPPLIIAEDVPRLVRWRDVLLTTIMWGIFVVLVDKEFTLFLGDYLEPLGFGPVKTDFNWLVYFELMLPFLLAIAVLAGLLVVFSIRTLLRRRRSLLLPEPQPLDSGDQARASGLDVESLIAARDWQIVVVHIDAGGKHRIERPNRRQNSGFSRSP